MSPVIGVNLVTQVTLSHCLHKIGLLTRIQQFRTKFTSEQSLPGGEKIASLPRQEPQPTGTTKLATILRFEKILEITSVV